MHFWRDASQYSGGAGAGAAPCQCETFHFMQLGATVPVVARALVGKATDASEAQPAAVLYRAEEPPKMMQVNGRVAVLVGVHINGACVARI